MIAPVPAADDRRLDPYRHVADPAWVEERGLFVAEGRLVVERLLELDGYDVHSILVNRAAHDAMFERLARANTTVLVCDDPTLASITGYNFHRGCLALVRRPPPRNPRAFAGARRLLAVESVTNPDNVGGLFRTAAAFGVEGVLLSAESADPLYRKSVRTSMGASLRLPYARATDWLSVLHGYRAAGLRLIALTPAADAVDLRAFARTVEPEDRLAVLVGSEGGGLGGATLALADARVRIPIDTAIDSLNVVVAAGVALAELR